MTTYALKPGTLIVLEGLDKTGKTTQSEALRHTLDPTSTVHVHMPSGLSAFTDETYSMLESDFRAPTSGIARQLAHLACHADSVPQLVEVLQTRAVVLDRWWWSTLAYGWYSGDLPRAGITEDGFRNLIGSIWSPVSASVIFLFDKPYAPDSNNSDPILAGYQQLAAQHEILTVRVPQGEPQDVATLVLDELRSRSLLIE